MKITLKQLKALDACPEGIGWYKKQGTRDLNTLVKNAIGSGITEMRFANWGIVRMTTKPQKVEYAIFAARQVLSIFEDKYPEDKRPRGAIEAAEAYLKTPSDDNRKASDAAADAAYAAAAYAAAYADAAYAAAVYASDAADAAARAKLMAKILRNGVRILNKKGE